MYTLQKQIGDMPVNCVINDSTESLIPFALANTDYANFKAQILADQAQLQDADGNLMSADAAKAFVKTLP